MNKFAGLLLDGLHHARMRVAGGENRDAGGEIEVSMPIDIPDIAALAQLDHEWIDAPSRRYEHVKVAFDHRSRARTGNFDGLGDRRGGIFDQCGHTCLLAVK